MSRNNVNLEASKIGKAYLLLRIISLLSFVFLIAFFKYVHHQNNNRIAFFFVLVYIILYFIIFTLTFTSNYVRERSNIILYILYFLTSISTSYSAYVYKFSETQVKFLFLVIFGSILLIKEIRYLKIYISFMTVLMVYFTLTVKQPNIDKFITLSIIFIFFVLSYYNLKSKLSTEKELVESQNQITQMAYHDALTGLPNRYRLKDFLAHVDGKIHKCAVMFLDLDDFKNINDTFGHSVGDTTLLQVAQRLRNCVRKEDTIFRFGGDEFVLVLNDINEEDTIKTARKVIDEFKEAFVIKQHEVFITPSIGISFYPTDGIDEEVLIKNADVAMYRAKNTGKNNYKFFSQEMDNALKRKIELANGLRKALQNNEFILYYQPQINLDTYKIWGLEALIRWKHPDHGLISPAEFIPIAEETGLIIPIGEWVLETACKQSMLWQEEELVDIPVAVNVSAIQLKNSDFIETVRKHINSTGINPDSLVIEFTESIMQDTSKSLKIVNDLKSLGVKVAIDDFGTGYSSLSLLKNLNIDILKIDSYFIKDIVENPNTLTIIKLIIDMGYKLDFSIIIEGIENEFQAQIVHQNGCKFGQGYLFSFPLPSEEVKLYLDKDYPSR